MVSRSLCILALIVFCAACGNKPGFEDKVLVKITDLQDRRMKDSLLIYLASDNRWHQKAAVRAFGSVQDTSFIRVIAKTQVDPYSRPDVAFALGQTNSEAAIALLKNMSLSNDRSVEEEAYEALGKVINQKDLDLFKRPQEGFSLNNGIAWGIYRAGLRGITDSERIDIEALALGDEVFSNSARLGAAHFFARATYTPTPAVVAALKKGVVDRDVEIRMAATSALAKIKPEDAIEGLTNGTKDSDYRVRVSAARALRTQPWDISKSFYQKLLADSNVHVSVAAAEAIGPIVPAADSALLLDWARNARHWRSQATLYECYLRVQKSGTVSKEIQGYYWNMANVYQKAALLTALSYQYENYPFIFEQFKIAPTRVIKSTAASGIARINRLKEFPRERKQEFASMYREIISSSDQGSIMFACEALKDSTLGYKEIITDVAFLEDARAKLSLPQDYETYVPLEQAINYFKGLPPPPPLKNDYNHPIDWTVAELIPPDQKVTITTTKGDIVLRLFVDEAPGSVVNFVQLVHYKFYDGKFFHRVVPNFVIQTGCERGDGFGSLNYSIRSEFTTRKYKAGSVGMASAGKDTEGTQWFITHSPTPHLDGKYTIFAEVIEGMDVVHQIEVGDQIITARLTD